ncbi:MAG: LPXTG cell wall anchor domain-containing protein [Clostridia bacterium]|nr:LPXTG cell wall anchor domain-containing protein [Clostridia bacterium]
MPETGGKGVLTYTIAGTLLMIAGAAALYKKQKSRGEAINQTNA